MVPQQPRGIDDHDVDIHKGHPTRVTALVSSPSSCLMSLEDTMQL